MSEKSDELISKSLTLARDSVKRIKVNMAPSGQSTKCPSVLNEIGTYFTIKQISDGTITFSCNGVKDSKICPECPIFVSKK